jgi:hypothetical protein
MVQELLSGTYACMLSLRGHDIENQPMLRNGVASMSVFPIVDRTGPRRRRLVRSSSAGSIHSARYEQNIASLY